MRLQTDPSVIYGLGEKFDGNLRRRDLLNDTPYNSYTRAGLPPTPIALPGRAALEAAVRPAKTKALYFVATGLGDGRHFFATPWSRTMRTSRGISPTCVAVAAFRYAESKCAADSSRSREWRASASRRRLRTPLSTFAGSGIEPTRDARAGRHAARREAACAGARAETGSGGPDRRNCSSCSRRARATSRKSSVRRCSKGAACSATDSPMRRRPIRAVAAA